MIRSIAIENVQSHISSELPFHEGVNVITGDTDAGKSVIIKLIRWVKDNRPTGEEYKNWDAAEDDQMAGEIITDEDTVAIIRKDGKTSYSLNNGKPLEALDKSVPLEITEALNLADYNIQTQFQNYFLLQDTPGEVARKINELTGLDVIDTLYSNIAHEIRNTNTEINISKNVIKETKESLKQYQNLDEIDKLITSIENTYQISLDTTSKINFITKLVRSYDSIQKEWEEANTVVELEKTVDSLLKDQVKLDSLKEKQNNINTILSPLKEIEDDMENNNMWLEVEKPCSVILEQCNKLETVQNKLADLVSWITSINKVLSDIEYESDRKDNYTKQYMALIEKENICPIANIAFPKQCLTNIKNNL